MKKISLLLSCLLFNTTTNQLSAVNLQIEIDRNFINKLTKEHAFNNQSRKISTFLNVDGSGASIPISKQISPIIDMYQITESYDGQSNKIIYYADWSGFFFIENISIEYRNIIPRCSIDTINGHSFQNCYSGYYSAKMLNLNTFSEEDKGLGDFDTTLKFLNIKGSGKTDGTDLVTINANGKIILRHFNPQGIEI